LSVLILERGRTEAEGTVLISRIKFNGGPR